MALPEHLPHRLPAGLCVFGMTYACGLQWAGTPKANPKPLNAREVIDTAAESGLSWVEMPPALLGADSPEELAAVRAYAEDRGIGFVLPAGRAGEEELRRALEVAAAVGAPTVRFTLSGV